MLGAADTHENGIEPGEIEYAPQGGSDRDQYLIVLIGAVGLDSLGLKYADHFKRNTANPDVLSDGILPGKEFLGYARAQNGYPSCLPVVIVVEEAPSLDRKTAHLQIGGGGAQDPRRHGTAAGLGRECVLESWHRRFHGGQFGDCLIIFHGEGRDHAADLFPGCGVLDLGRPHHQQVRSHGLGLANDLLLCAACQWR